MKITDQDRELAAELVDLLTGDTDERDVKCVAIVLAAHRLSDRPADVTTPGQGDER